MEIVLADPHPTGRNHRELGNHTMPYRWSGSATVNERLAWRVIVDCVLSLVLRARWIDRPEAILLYKGYLETQIT